MPENQENEDKKVVMSSATDSSIKPSDNTRMAPAEQDEILDPMKTRDTETGKMKRVELGINTDTSGIKSRRTIKLKPLLKKPGTATSQIGKAEDSEETVSMERKSLQADQASEEPSQTSEQPAATAEDDTVKLEKRESPKMEESPKPDTIPIPSVPGIKQTIKLRPSSTITPSPLTPVPETEGGEIPRVSHVSNPTLKLEPVEFGEESAAADDEQTVAMPKKTIRLVPKKPGEETAAPLPAAPLPATEPPPKVSVPTVKLPSGDAAVSEGKSLPPLAKKTLRLKTTKHPTGTASAVPAIQPSQPAEESPASAAAEQEVEAASPPVEEKEAAYKPESVEPGIIFTLAACLTFFALVYFAWMVIGQYGEQYFDWKNANVPGLSGKVK